MSIGGYRIGCDFLGSTFSVCAGIIAFSKVYLFTRGTSFMGFTLPIQILCLANIIFQKHNPIEN
ncbi:hypothetical protein HMPREF9141_1850 [Prevotella multiformis DSM 16608]|uniref:Uncharacterized protein n=1 Tax=Prevotella multiformis DSM 16608 TaxID=888743 RepID=F0F8D3_9BACT|nr:hypothetical protein HMPREF9141_1850 [Prevotella multiformis DSM 16608]